MVFLIVKIIIRQFLPLAKLIFVTAEVRYCYLTNIAVSKSVNNSVIVCVVYSIICVLIFFN